MLGWSIVLQPLYLCDGNMYWIEYNAIADALTGKLGRLSGVSAKAVCSRK